ncbi:hypothetical protein IFM89_032202 [Coptis chinensis]|uniref:PIN-like protein n=1 Tax=Coptis chinensis TaxID=261450 RepID=A0A835HYJ2_9MAGN|nr:hypothetical protein IFM89_032202 [Coptis chinensis]
MNDIDVGPRSSKLGLRTTAAIIFGRLVLVPPAGLGIVMLADKLGLLPVGDKMFRFVLLLHHTMPTSVLAVVVRLTLTFVTSQKKMVDPAGGHQFPEIENCANSNKAARVQLQRQLAPRSAPPMLSRHTIAQRARRERECLLSSSTSHGMQLSSQDIRIHLSPTVTPNRKTLARHARSDKEKMARLPRSTLIKCACVPPNTHQDACYAPIVGGSASAPNENHNNRKNKVFCSAPKPRHYTITYLVGSSSKGDYTRENDVLFREKIKDVGTFDQPMCVSQRRPSSSNFFNTQSERCYERANCMAAKYVWGRNVESI